MADAVQEKSRGLKFAEQQLLRHGWEQGKGLGREENGISEAIKVKVKCDKGGVGHSQGEQFTFHWWDHVFNKASSSLEVESDQNGVQVKKLAEEEEGGMISNKKPRKATLAKDKLYGCFVKSATLLSGQELPEQKSSSSDSSSSDDDDQRLDLSSTTKLSDADLMKACGGRTAHKGARHGLTMSAKLARLQQQEQEFMATYGKTGQSAHASAPERAAGAADPSAQTPATDAAEEEETRSKKAKKKKKRRKDDDAGERTSEESAAAVVSGSPDRAVAPKKKKKKRKSMEDGEAAMEAAMSEDQPAAVADEAPHTTKKPKKKKKRTTEEDGGGLNGEARETAGSPQGEGVAGTEEPSVPDPGEGLTLPPTHTDPNTAHKKKKKKRKKEEEDATSESKQENAAVDEAENEDAGTVEDVVPKKKKRDGAVEDGEREEHLVVEEGEREEPKRKRKKKKCKEDRQSAEDGNTTPKKKKKTREQENGAD